MRPRSKKPTKFGSCLEPSPFGILRQWLFSETRAIAAGREPIVAKRKPVIGENIETPMTGKGDSENETLKLPSLAPIGCPDSDLAMQFAVDGDLGSL
jgi:hypothetical protein